MVLSDGVGVFGKYSFICCRLSNLLATMESAKTQPNPNAKTNKVAMSFQQFSWCHFEFQIMVGCFTMFTDLAYANRINIYELGPLVGCFKMECWTICILAYLYPGHKWSKVDYSQIGPFVL